MANSYTSENAIELVSGANDVLNQISSITSSEQEYQKQMKAIIEAISMTEAKELLSQIYLHELDFHAYSDINRYMQQGAVNVWDVYERSTKGNTTIFPGTFEALVRDVAIKLQTELPIWLDRNPEKEKKEELIEMCFKAILLKEQFPVLETYRNKFEKTIKTDIEALKPRTQSGAIRWFFVSPSKKRQVDSAYGHLSGVMDDQETQAVRKSIQAANDIKVLPRQTALLSYQANNSSISTYLSDAFRKNWNADYDEPEYSFKEAQEIVATLSDLLDCSRDMTEDLKAAKQRIISAGNKLLAKEAAKILRQISVDELNRHKQGFRISALKEAGYQTIFDVYAASRWSIASVKGISESSGRAIKNEAKKIFEESSKSAKIRLSYDDQSEEASALVYEVARYYLTSQLHEQLRAIARNSSKLNGLIPTIRKGLDYLNWLNGTSEERSQITQAFGYLRKFYETKNISALQHIPQDSAKLKSFTKHMAWEEFKERSIEFFNILEELMPGALGNEDAVYGLPEDLAREIQEECIFPDGLLCKLRRYQEWGVKYILHQERVLLGDEMGLGKTVQAIATMVSLKNTGATHFIVVCPASVLSNWCREIRKHSKLSVIKVHGATRKESFEEWIRAGGVAVTTFETTEYIKDMISPIFKYAMLIVDEAHYIKNPGAKRSKNVTALSLHTNRRLFMTGTALENKVEEMIALIRLLQPKIAMQVNSMVHISNAPQFKNLVAPVYYRRKRKDVLTELPELIENEEWCSLGAIEESVYENAVLSRQFAQARRVSWSVDDLKDSVKATRLSQIVKEAKADNRKVIVFSFFLDTIKKIYQHLGDEICTSPINGSISPDERQSIIDEFEKAPAGTVLLAQIQAGGTGLNIQAASVVVLCEPQFKPSIENQAISRAYRMGQTRNVLVHRLLCENTVDEKLMDLLKEKQDLFDAFADESVAAAKSAEVDDSKFSNIIEEEIKRINEKRKSA